MDAFIGFILLIAIVVLVINIQRKKVHNPNQLVQTKSFMDNMLVESQQFCDRVYEEQALPEIEISIQLKKGEKAYLRDFAEFHEQRAKSVSTRGGGAIRVAKGIYIGGSQGTSRSVPEMRIIDQGDICFTNKRIVFIGENAIKEYALNKIISISTMSNGFWIASEGKQKRQFFKTRNNPMLWYVMLKIHNALEDKTEIPHIQLTLDQGQ